MKANELMIDDWVYNKNTARPMQIYPVIFSQMFRSNPNATTEDYNIFPIPITPEILERNGFKNNGEDKNMLYWNWSICKDCVSYDKETGIIRIFHCLGSLIFVNPLRYVHQLQHALRLCGIEKEIIL